MRFTTDHCMVQGADHAVCQDYALSGCVPVTDDATHCRGWAALADGCSSSRDSDWGARLLVKAVENTLYPFPDTPTPDALLCPIWRHARESATRIGGLTPTCLDATLLLALADTDTFHVAAWGDGVIAARERLSRRWHLHVLSYAANYPKYPAYAFHKNRRAAWEAIEGNERTVHSFCLEADGSEGSAQDSSDETQNMWRFPLARFDCVALLSDGVGSLRCSDDSVYPLPTALSILLGFKGMAGEFVQRRWQRARKELRQSGIWHSDDLSIAALYAANDTPRNRKDG